MELTPHMLLTLGLEGHFCDADDHRVEMNPQTTDELTRMVVDHQPLTFVHDGQSYSVSDTLLAWAQATTAACACAARPHPQTLICSQQELMETIQRWSHGLHSSGLFLACDDGPQTKPHVGWEVDSQTGETRALPLHACDMRIDTCDEESLLTQIVDALHPANYTCAWLFESDPTIQGFTLGGRPLYAHIMPMAVLSQSCLQELRALKQCV